MRLSSRLPLLLLPLAPFVPARPLAAQQRTAERTHLAAEWDETAVRFRGQAGQRLAVACPPGEPRSAWGTDLYTDDSSICTAALHAGLVTADRGGVVTVVVAPGAAQYAGTTRNGVATQSYGAHDGSFRVEALGAGGDAGLVGWQTTAAGLERVRGGTLTVTCPPQGAIARVWGSDVYSDDSSICTAAAHAGVITVAQGGRVTITSAGEQERFTAAARNGVSSREFGKWPRSFSVQAAGVAQQPAASAPATAGAAVRPPALVVEGQGVTVTGATGGWWVAGPIVEGGSSYYRTKRISGGVVEPLEVELLVTDEAAKPYSWISSWLAGASTPSDVALVEGATRRDLQGAMITTLVVPEMNASSSATGRLRLTIAAQGARESAQSGGTAPKLAKTWITSRFRVSVPGLPTSRVSRIDSIVVRRPVVADAAGVTRTAAPVAGTMTVSNLVLTISETDIGPWRQWLESFVINGNNGDANEKVVDIQLLDQAGSSLRLLRAHNVGILAIRPLPPAASGVRQHRVEMYVERLEMQ